MLDDHDGSAAIVAAMIPHWLLTLINAVAATAFFLLLDN